jgi:hypothetical protein
VNNLSQQDLNLEMESLQVDSPVKIYQLPVSEQDWLENGVDFFGKSADCLTKQERRILSSKMCLAYFPAIKVQIWPLFSKRWSSAGIVSHTGCLMLNTSEYHKEGVGSLLSDVLETQGDHLKKYSLSPKAALGILRRANRKEKTLPIQLQTALENVVREGAQGAK